MLQIKNDCDLHTQSWSSSAFKMIRFRPFYVCALWQQTALRLTQKSHDERSLVIYFSCMTLGDIGALKWLGRLSVLLRDNGDKSLN